MVVFDTSKKGLDTITGRPWKSEVVKYVLSREETQSREAYDYMCSLFKETNNPDFNRSRAAVIFYLDDLVEDGFLSKHEITGKGGHRGVYTPNVKLRGFWAAVVNNVVTTAMVESGYRDLWRE